MAERVNEDKLDEAISDSFPASDPPSWTTGSPTGAAAQRTPAVQPEAPVGSLLHPLVPQALGVGPCAPTATERLLRDGPVAASAALAVGSLAMMLAGRRAPASWMLQASTWLLMLATYQRSGR
jgi:hypothetical protein